MKPRLFVASSHEGIEIAYAVQENLKNYAECTVWSQGAFELTRTTLESLFNILDRFDGGVFVFHPDDKVIKRHLRTMVTRDNVVFELGLFYGRCGRDSNFIIAPSGVKLDMPTDLLGITPPTFETKRSDGNLVAALGPACSQILRALKKIPRFAKLTEEAEVADICKDWSDSFVSISGPKREALKGEWHGESVARFTKELRMPPGHPRKVSINFTFNPAARLIRATSVFKSPDVARGPVMNDYVGGFCSDTQLRLDYRKHEPGVTGFGTLMFEVSPDLRHMKGRIIGFSSHLGQSFVAEVTLTKKASRKKGGVYSGRSGNRKHSRS